MPSKYGFPDDADRAREAEEKRKKAREEQESAARVADKLHPLVIDVLDDFKSAYNLRWDVRRQSPTRWILGLPGATYDRNPFRERLPLAVDVVRGGHGLKLYYSEWFFKEPQIDLLRSVLQEQTKLDAEAESQDWYRR